MKASMWRISTSKRTREKRKKLGTNEGMSERERDRGRPLLEVEERLLYLFIYFYTKPECK